MNTVYRRYMKQVLVCLALPIAIIMTFNVVVDPFRAYRWSDTKSLAPYYRSEYVSAAESFRHENPDVVFVGSSRVLDGFREVNMDDEGRHVLRVAVRGTSWVEQSQILNHIVGSEQPPKEILFGLDLDTILRSSRPSDFEHSRFSRSYQPINYHSQNLLSLDALQRSFRVLLDWQCGQSSEASIEQQVAEKGSLDVFRSQLSRDIPMCSPENAIAGVQTAMVELGDLIELAHEREIRFTVVILPVHALSYEKLTRQGYGRYIDVLKRSLVACCDLRSAPVWDFTGYSNIAIESVPMSIPSDQRTKTTMRWFYDSDHFTPVLGDVVLKTVLSQSSPKPSEISIGEIINGDNIDEHLANVHLARSSYLMSDPKELALLARSGRPIHLSRNST